MECYFCQKLFKAFTILQGDINSLIVYYECSKCKPHRIIYHKMHDKTTDDLIKDSIRIDEFSIIRNYVKNKTSFNKDIIVNLNDNEQPKLRTYPKQVYEISGIWNIPANDIETVKHKLQIYTTFS